ncbi:hypothetical protein DYD21_07570 [Rhodohalobacter sp. SW132]|nr:hypothetical protein [Rhodohalobacter sp. SW132]REL37634.1 hypothetical protein DYD21_07570 [Rhodohalobacter sp. SW132]
MGTSEKLQTLKHSDKEVSSYLKTLSDINLDGSYYLTIAAGKNKSAKKDFYKKVKKQAGNSFKEIDLREIITTQLDETAKNLDELFLSLGSEKYVWLSHGDQLGGVYTGYSYSVRRYATPQERYLLEKITDSEKIFFIDLDDKHTVNNTMRRHAQTLITFEHPSSFLGRLKQITINGSSFESSRKPLV